MSDPDKSTGRAWVFGDSVNTDVLAPGAYIKDYTRAIHSMDRGGRHYLRHRVTFLGLWGNITSWSYPTVNPAVPRGSILQEVERHGELGDSGEIRRG